MLKNADNVDTGNQTAPIKGCHQLQHWQSDEHQGVPSINRVEHRHRPRRPPPLSSAVRCIKCEGGSQFHASGAAMEKERRKAKVLSLFLLHFIHHTFAYYKLQLTVINLSNCTQSAARCGV